MKKTIVGLITPHILRIVDLAQNAEAGINVDWHVKDAVAKTFDDLGHMFNAHDLLEAYIQSLEQGAKEAGPARSGYARVLQAAASHADHLLKGRG